MVFFGQNSFGEGLFPAPESKKKPRSDDPQAFPFINNLGALNCMLVETQVNGCMDFSLKFLRN